MSKLNSLSQSMAALFSPERERARKTQASEASGNSTAQAGTFRVAGAEALRENAPSGDSLGNPSSPGYEGPIKKNTAPAKAESSNAEKTPEQFKATVVSPNTIRLSAGFEKILLTQKKLCEKAVNLFTQLDGSGRYRTQRKGKLLGGKSRGCIVDLNSAEAPAAPPKKPNAA